MTAYFNVKAKAIERSREVCREQNADNARGVFLRSLHQNYASDSLTPFESEFLASFLEHNLKAEAGLDFKWFSPGRRTVVDRMMKRYCAALPLPANSKLKIENSKLVSGLASTCDYFVRDAGRQQRCNEPATHCSADHKIAYCTAHAEHVERGAWIKGKRVKQSIVALNSASHANLDAAPARPVNVAAAFSQLRSAAGLAALLFVFTR